MSEDERKERAAHAMAEFVSEQDIQNGILCPPLDQLNKVSLEVAKRVGAEAIKANVTQNDCPVSEFKHNNDVERLNTLIEKMRWTFPCGPWSHRPA